MKFFIALFFMANITYANNHFNKVVTIIFENTSFESAKKNLYFQDLARKGTLFTHFSAISHPSLPNYIAMIAGSTFSITNDDNYNLDSKHLGDLLEDKKLDWRVYAEDYPGNCFLGSSYKKYARKHVPFLSFTNITKDSKRCEKIKNLNSFIEDLNKSKLQTYSMIVPNLDNDGHDTGILFASEWLKNFFDPLKLPDDLLLIITFDEGMGKNNSIYTLFIGKMIKKNFESNLDLNHYSILKLIEDNFALSSLHREDERAKNIENIWN